MKHEAEQEEKRAQFLLCVLKSFASNATGPEGK